MAAMAGDDLRKDHRQRQFRVLAMQGFDVVDEGDDGRAVGRDDDLQGQVIAPPGPVPPEALGFLFGDADVDGEDRLEGRGRVGQGPHAREIECGDRHDREEIDLLGKFFPLTSDGYRSAFLSREDPLLLCE